MQIVRTIVWVVLLIAFLLFAINNWQTLPIKIWENLILETKVPALVVVSFLIGLIPMYLVHRGVTWRLQRRISALESAARTAAAALAPATVPPVVEEEPVPPGPALSAEPLNDDKPEKL